MRIALDTSAYSAAMRGHAQIADVLRHADQIVLTPVVLGELICGFRHGSRLAENLAMLERFRETPRVKTVGLDEQTAERYAEIAAYLRRNGTPIPTNDVWIAASAMQLGLRVLTTDPHFKKIPHVLSEVLAP